MNPSSPSVQPRLDLIPHDYRGEIIAQRAKDGYINATAMCQAAGRKLNDYTRLGTTSAFITELAGSTGIPADLLVSTITTGSNEHRGTWVHPQVATHLAQWASPRFAVLVSKWVVEWMTGVGQAERAWRVFNDRLDLVSDQVPLGFFCIFRETADVYASFIRGGINPGLKIILDISVGQHWSKHWTKHGLQEKFGDRARYEHRYPAYYSQSLSNPQTPLCYPEDALPAFRRWLRDEYIPLKLPIYLKGQVAQGKIANTEATGAIEALESRDRRRSLPGAA